MVIQLLIYCLAQHEKMHTDEFFTNYLLVKLQNEQMRQSKNTENVRKVSCRSTKGVLLFFPFSNSTWIEPMLTSRRKPLYFPWGWSSGAK